MAKFMDENEASLFKMAYYGKIPGKWVNKDKEGDKGKEAVNAALVAAINAYTPPAAPGADPAAPGAPPAGEEDKADTGDDITKKIDSLAKRSDEDIKKTLKAGLQDGSKEKETMEIMSKVINSIDKDTPENVKRMAIEFQKEFDIEVPADMEEDGENNKAPAAPAAPAVPGQPPAPTAAPATPAPIKESRLQTNLREYLA